MSKQEIERGFEVGKYLEPHFFAGMFSVRRARAVADGARTQLYELFREPQAPRRSTCGKQTLTQRSARENQSQSVAF